MLALAPITAKKICIRKVPSTSAPSSLRNCAGSEVARITVNAVTTRMPPPRQPTTDATPNPIQHRPRAMASASAVLPATGKVAAVSRCCVSSPESPAASWWRRT